MMKYIVLVALVAVFLTASSQYFEFDFTTPTPTQAIKKEVKGDVTEEAWDFTDDHKKYLMDEDNRVSQTFKIAPYYYPNVNFWFLIYTRFDSNQVVIHDKNNLSIIYKILDYSSLHQKELPRNTIYVLQEKISSDKVKVLKEQLNKLAKDPYSEDQDAEAINRSLKIAGVELPSTKLERAAFYNKLKDNVRTQVGQKNFIKDGMKRSLPYKAFLDQYFIEKNLPSELLAIPFLESSFNPRAESKVGAMGIWQFMPWIAKSFMPKRTKDLDYRKNIGVASISAAFLLSENFRILKSWDMAVTAYNSGTKHLLKTKREIATQDVDLEDIITHSDSQHFGFASKNFYSEFLALVHTIAYREEVYQDLHQNDRYNVNEPLQFYMSKCSLQLKKVLNEKQLEDVDYHNHYLDPKKTYKRGLIITAKEELPKSKFLKLSFDEITKRKPKDWDRYLRNQSCSTR